MWVNISVSGDRQTDLTQ